MAKKVTRKKRARRKAKPAEPTVEKVEPPLPEPEVETFPLTKVVPDAEPESTEDDIDNAYGVDLSDLVDSIDDNQGIVELSCGDHVRVSTYENKHIADAAEEAAAAYVMTIGRFPDPTEPVMTTVATKSATFGPFVVACSLVVEAKELRG